MYLQNICICKVYGIMQQAGGCLYIVFPKFLYYYYLKTVWENKNNSCVIEKVFPGKIDRDELAICCFEGRILKRNMLRKKSESELWAIITEVVNEIKKLLKEDIYKIVLYGSCARGDFGYESDIDIMIIMNCQKEEVFHYRKQISKIASRIGLENDIEISLLLRDKDTFEQSREVLPFYKNIQREGVALYG